MLYMFCYSPADFLKKFNSWKHIFCLTNEIGFEQCALTEVYDWTGKLCIVLHFKGLIKCNKTERD